MPAALSKKGRYLGFAEWLSWFEKSFEKQKEAQAKEEPKADLVTEERIAGKNRLPMKDFRRR